MAYYAMSSSAEYLAEIESRLATAREHPPCPLSGGPTSSYPTYLFDIHMTKRATVAVSRLRFRNRDYVFNRARGLWCILDGRIRRLTTEEVVAGFGGGDVDIVAVPWGSSTATFQPSVYAGWWITVDDPPPEVQGQPARVVVQSEHIQQRIIATSLGIGYLLHCPPEQRFSPFGEIQDHGATDRPIISQLPIDTASRLRCGWPGQAFDVPIQLRHIASSNLAHKPSNALTWQALMAPGLELKDSGYKAVVDHRLKQAEADPGLDMAVLALDTTEEGMPLDLCRFFRDPTMGETIYHRCIVRQRRIIHSIFLTHVPAGSAPPPAVMQLRHIYARIPSPEEMLLAMVLVRRDPGRP